MIKKEEKNEINDKKQNNLEERRLFKIIIFPNHFLKSIKKNSYWSYNKHFISYCFDCNSCCSTKKNKKKRKKRKMEKN